MTLMASCEARPETAMETCFDDDDGLSSALPCAVDASQSPATETIAAPPRSDLSAITERSEGAAPPQAGNGDSATKPPTGNEPENYEAEPEKPPVEAMAEGNDPPAGRRLTEKQRRRQLCKQFLLAKT